jgi:hypothetical protein
MSMALTSLSRSALLWSLVLVLALFSKIKMFCFLCFMASSDKGHLRRGGEGGQRNCRPTCLFLGFLGAPHAECRETAKNVNKNKNKKSKKKNDRGKVFVPLNFFVKDFRHGFLKKKKFHVVLLNSPG